MRLEYGWYQQKLISIKYPFEQSRALRIGVGPVILLDPVYNVRLDRFDLMAARNHSKGSTATRNSCSSLFHNCAGFF